MDFQNLYPEKESSKTFEWASTIVQNISYYAQQNINFNVERYKTFQNYNVVNGIYDVSQFKYFTEPFGMATPATWRNFDLIRAKYEKIVGDYLDQPLAYGAHITNREGVERKVEMSAKVAAEIVTAPHTKMIHQATGVDTTDPSVAGMSPQSQLAALTMSKKDLIEEFAENALDYLINRYNIDKQYVAALWDMIICSKAFTYTEIINGDPITIRVDPRAIIYDLDCLENNTLDNSAWQAHERYLTVSEILQEYRNFLTKDQVERIKEMTLEFITSLIKDYPLYTSYYKMTYNTVRIRVIHAVWCSEKSVDFFKTENEYDPENPILREVTDEWKEKNKKFYKKGKEDGSIISMAGDDWWEGTMIGQDLSAKCRRVPNQPRSQNWGGAMSKSPYNGVVHNPIDGITMSLTDRLVPWQTMWNIIWYNVDFLLARTNGKVLQYDISQRPDSLTNAQVITLAKNYGITFIDSRKESVRSNQFNQFSTADMSNTPDVLSLINAATQIETIIDSTIGLNRGWSGDTKASDTLGNTQNNVIQANSTLRPLYQSHATVVEQSLNQMADLFKYAGWESGQRMSYILDDGVQKSFVIPEGFRLDDLGIKFKTGFAEKSKMQTIVDLAAKALQSGALDFENALNMVDASTASEAKAILKRGLDVVKQNQIAQQQAELQNEHEKNVAAAARGQVAIETSKINADSAIAVANIKEKGATDRNIFDKEVEKELTTSNQKSEIDKIAFKALNDAQLQQLPPPAQIQSPPDEGQPQTFPQGNNQQLPPQPSAPQQ